MRFRCRHCLNGKQDSHTPAAIAIPAIIGAGASLVGAKMSSNASQDAAKTQSAAADKALAAQQQGYQTQRADFSPYLQAGTAALGRLGQTAGTYTGGMPAPQAPRPGLGQLGTPPPSMPTTMSAMPSVPSGQMPPPQGRAMAGMTPPAGGLITVQAPTGETAKMTQAQAQMAVQKGARIVGGA